VAQDDRPLDDRGMPPPRWSTTVDARRCPRCSGRDCYDVRFALQGKKIGTRATCSSCGLDEFRASPLFDR
jgi:hypothetical protein